MLTPPRAHVPPDPADLCVDRPADHPVDSPVELTVELTADQPDESTVPFIPFTEPLVRADLTGRGPVGRVVAEWARLARRPAVLRTVNGWSFIDPPVAHLDDVLERAGFGRPTTDSEGGKILWHLADLARTDELAARIVLHRILPALMSIARRRGRIHPKGPYAAMEELLTTAWIVIRTYPSHRRPRKVAANLVRDCEYHAFVRTQRLRRPDETPVEGIGVVAQPVADTDPAEELAELLADARDAGVAEQDITLLQALAAGGTTKDLAIVLGVSPRTVRNWRLRAIDAVRQSAIT